MENNNSEKTGRLTPGQIDAVVRISGEITGITETLKSLHVDTRRNYSLLVIPIGSKIPAWPYFRRDWEDDNQERVVVNDPEICTFLENYFTEKKSRLESELEAVISGEGGER